MQEMFAPERIAADMIDFYKVATLNACNTVTLIQEQAEKIYTIMFEQGLSVQKEGMKLWQEWLNTNKKNRDEFSKLMGSSFDRTQEFFAPRKKS
jgi:polyhydroxyalkanoate synthesis regulator phasin